MNSMLFFLKSCVSISSMTISACCACRYYDLDAYHNKHKMEKEIKKGYKKESVAEPLTLFLAVFLRENGGIGHQNHLLLTAEEPLT